MGVDGDDDDKPGWVAPAAETASNLVTWLATAAHEPAGGIAAAGSPLVRGAAEAAFTSLSRRWQALSRRGGEQVLEHAAEAAGVTVDELEARSSSTDQRVLLVGLAMEAGTRTADADKIRALGRALAAGVSDDALVEPATLIALALADLEPPHVHLLRRMAQETPPRVYGGGRTRMVTEAGPFRPSPWELPQMIAALPALQPVLRPVLATLTRHALLIEVDRTSELVRNLDRELTTRERTARENARSRYESPRRLSPRLPDSQWKVTGFGLDVVALLQDAGPTPQ
ncbi:MAG: hypothetical protein H7233_16430 [Pseudorhodobacter sp.]|nr:hypothetical protein [Frankiaceae bacterium]